MTPPLQRLAGSGGERGFDGFGEFGLAGAGRRCTPRITRSDFPPHWFIAANHRLTAEVLLRRRRR